MLIVLLLPTVVVMIALIRAYAEVDTSFVEEWARAYALTLTSENRAMVRWYLRNARVLRTWGALGGLFLPPLVRAAIGLGGAGGVDWALIFVGYLIGALYAEVSLVRPVDPRRRSASLVPRELADYLPRRLLVAPRVLAVAAVAGAVAVWVLPYGEHSPEPPNRATVAVLAVVAVGLAVALERLQRWVVQRPQPFASPSLLAADDAIRAQSVHSLAGSGIAVLFVLCSGISFALALSDVQVLRWVMWIPAAFGFVFALFTCQYYGHRAWRVSRPVPVPPIPPGTAPA